MGQCLELPRISKPQNVGNNSQKQGFQKNEAFLCGMLSSILCVDIFSKLYSKNSVYL